MAGSFLPTQQYFFPNSGKIESQILLPKTELQHGYSPHLRVIWLPKYCLIQLLLNSSRFPDLINIGQVTLVLRKGSQKLYFSVR